MKKLIIITSIMSSMAPLTLYGMELSQALQSSVTQEVTNPQQSTYKAIDLKWEFAKVGHLLNTDVQDIHVIGFDEFSTEISTKELVLTALLDTFKSVKVELTDKDSKSPSVSVDMSKLLALADIINLMRTEAITRDIARTDNEMTLDLLKAVYSARELSGSRTKSLTIFDV